MRTLRWLLLVALPSLLLLVGVVAAAEPTAEEVMGQSVDTVHQFRNLLTTAAMVGPVGINPLLGLGGLGIAAWTGAWTPPGTIGFVGHPAFWIAAIILGAIIQFGRSFKLTKPVAEALGTGESVIGVAVVAVAGLALLQEAGVVRVEQASVILASLLFVMVASTAVLLVIVRTAFDVLVWLSPFPFVDLLFQALKAAATAVLLLLAVFAPGAAVVLNLILIVAAALALRWALRTTIFGVTVAGDLSFGWFRRDLDMPRSEEGLGPFTAFVVEVEGLARRQRGDLVIHGGEWLLRTRGLVSKGESRSLGAVRMSRELMGVKVASESAELLLPPRYRHLVDELARETGAAVVEDATLAPSVA